MSDTLKTLLEISDRLSDGTAQTLAETVACEAKRFTGAIEKEVRL